MRQLDLLNQYLSRNIASFLSRNSKCRFLYLICLHDTMTHQMSVHQNMRIADSLAGTLLNLLVDLPSYYLRSSTLTRQVIYFYDFIIMKLKISSNCRYRTSLVSVVSCFVSSLYSHIQFRESFQNKHRIDLLYAILLYSNLPCLYTLVINVCPSFYTSFVRISQHQL